MRDASRARDRVVRTVLKIHYAVMMLGSLMLGLLMTLVAGSMCNGCHPGLGESAGVLLDFGAGYIWLGLGVLLAVCSVGMYHFVRWLDAPPRCHTSLANTLLVFYVLWPFCVPVLLSFVK